MRLFLVWGSIIELYMKFLNSLIGSFEKSQNITQNFINLVPDDEMCESTFSMLPKSQRDSGMIF